MRTTRPFLVLLLTLTTTLTHAGEQPWPGDERADLVLPDALWAELTAALGHPAGEPLGFDRQELSDFGRDLHLMSSVRNAFRDVRQVPRLAGRISGELVERASDPAALVRQGYALTDIRAGRYLALPEESAIDDLAALLGDEPDAAEIEVWAMLPERHQRLVLRLYAGVVEATPWLRLAFDDDFLHAATGGRPTTDELYALATAPWIDERLEQLATTRKQSFEALERVDREYLAFGSVLLLAHQKRALDEWREATGEVPDDFPGLILETELGPIRIGTTASDVGAEPAMIAVDPGGDDRWHGRHGVPRSLAAPIALAIDLGGDDEWVGGQKPCAIACGLFGVGAVVDLAGNDTYSVRESGIGAAWYGTGIVIDEAGDDAYLTQGRWGQGAAHVGVAALINLAGDDTRICGHESQAMGSTYGAGLLVDLAGDDRYVARDDGNPSELYLGQSVAMSQGVGYGRRADLGDGHSLAGGYGVLVDAAGNDSYHSQVWSQGAGYWWAVGILEDLGGDDTYSNGKYSAGAAAHFAVGSQIDLSGDDTYNLGNETAVNQFQGHARDGAIGVSIDGDGDDRYRLHSHCGGSADLASIGLLWDRRGDDRYEVVFTEPDENEGWNGTPPLGSATVYVPFRSFRDDLPAYGLFLDSGGDDDYTASTAAENGTSWPSNRGPASRGVGLDVDLYIAAR